MLAPSAIVEKGQQPIDDQDASYDDHLFSLVILQKADELPDSGIGPKIPFGFGSHALRPHLQLAGIEAAAEDMKVGGGEGYLSLGILFQNPGLGEFHIFIGIGGLILLQDPVSGNSLLQQISLHGGRLGIALIRSLSSGSNENQILAGLGLLFPAKSKGSIDPPPQERGGASVPQETAAQDNDIILVIFRLVTGDDSAGDHGTDHHALPIEVEGGKEIADQVMHQYLGHAAGGIGMEEAEEEIPSHQEQSQKNTQDIVKSLPFMAKKGKVGNAQGQGKYQNKGQRQDHISPGRVGQQAEDLGKILSQIQIRFPNQPDRQDHMGHKDGQKEQEKTDIIDGIIRIGIVLDLGEESPQQQNQYQSQIDIKGESYAQDMRLGASHSQSSQHKGCKK